MSILLITPSHGPDFDRCRLLVASVDRFVSGLQEHWVLVDETDRAQFAPLQTGRTRVICTADIVPMAFRKWPLPGAWWRVKGAGWVRGWLLQQVVKLGVAAVADAPVLSFADSDTVFFRRWDAGALSGSQGVRLFREPRRFLMWRNRRYINWYQVAARYSGVTQQDEQEGGYIAQLTSWRRETVLALHRRIEAVSGEPWALALLRTGDFSEFVLYGAFAEHHERGLGHALSAQPLCLSSWYHHLPDREAMGQLRHHVQPQHVALHMQSNLGWQPPDYAGLLSALEQGAGLAREG